MGKNIAVAVKVKIINAHFSNGECLESLHDFLGVSDGDIVDATLWKGDYFVVDSDGNETYLRNGEFEVVE